jgi:hypothetical protein
VTSRLGTGKSLTFFYSVAVRKPVLFCSVQHFFSFFLCNFCKALRAVRVGGRRSRKKKRGRAFYLTASAPFCPAPCPAPPPLFRLHQLGERSQHLLHWTRRGLATGSSLQRGGGGIGHDNSTARAREHFAVEINHSGSDRFKVGINTS